MNKKITNSNVESTNWMYVSAIENSNLRKRIEFNLTWFQKNSSVHRISFYLTSIMIIVINASIPIINQIYPKYASNIVSTLSAIAAISASLIALFSMRENWFRSSMHAEEIKTECMLFNMTVGEYGEFQNKEDKERLLAERFEEIVRSDRNKWSKLNNKKLL